ncbi:hypothetical protein SCHPADRAFT_998747 [Schizopora paradoxa]|uniref:Uncharacterized protein n=1 Tax=Schizopora paradoxa TaxID=27342 RepID=A0A0H2S3Y8_9AGAM|nr:hypothetical protein SCHPADRAFT_998747 [Schizopora paradoxa]
MSLEAEFTKAIDDAFQCLLEQKKLGIESQERREEIFKASLKPFFRGRIDEELEEFPFQAVLDIFYKYEPIEWKDMDPPMHKAIHVILSLSSKTAHLNLSESPSVSRTQPETNSPTPSIPKNNLFKSISNQDPSYNENDVADLKANPSQAQINATLAPLLDLQAIPDTILEKLRILRVAQARFLRLEADLKDAMDSFYQNEPSKEDPQAYKAYLVECDADITRKSEELTKVHKALQVISDDVLADIKNLEDGLTNINSNVIKLMNHKAD